ncbi:uncharacterized protein LOC135497519 [Lineus longissimus]|uniref:uncharacterized protein LOC135497519 n=1 Tax=Lineus longissimus TaxID=88925 RepID=UPI00315C6DFC
MPRQTIMIALSLTLLITILASLQEGEARVVIKGCPLTGYKREGNRCVFVGCPKGLRKIVRSNFRQRYFFCVKGRPNYTRRIRHRGFVSPHLIFAYVRQRIAPCRRIIWLRRRLHRVWKRVKQKETEIKAAEEKPRTRESAQKAWEKESAKQQKGLAVQRKLFSLLLRKVNIMDRRRGMRLAMAYSKLRWWIKVAERRIKETHAQLKKYIHELRKRMSGILKRNIVRAEMQLKRWRYFLRKLEFWMMKVKVILRRRRTRRRIGFAWRQVRRVKLAIKQIQQKIHSAAAGEKRPDLKGLIKRESLLWSLLTHRKTTLNTLLKERNRVRARRIENTLHQIKQRLTWAEKKIAYLSRRLKDKKETNRTQWIKRILVKWQHYLGRLQKREEFLTKRYKKNTKGSTVEDTNEKENDSKKSSVKKSKDDGLDTLRKLMVKKNIPNITIFKFHPPQFLKAMRETLK